jgi:serine protease Do
MTRYLLAALLVPALVCPCSADSKEVQALQEAVRKVIKETDPSVACVLVSRSERYREFGTATSTQPGRLGGFTTPAADNSDPARRELLRRLDLASPDTVPESYGSGVVIDASGLVLTNFHVVQNATKVYVRLPGKKGSYADVHAADGRSDLAVLKLLDPPADLEPARLGDGEKLAKGDFVVGVAYPFAAGVKDPGPTATHGIIGSLRRKAPGGTSENDRLRTLHQLGTLIQTDLRLNLSCSGGGVFNLDGELIALTTTTAAVVGGETAGGFAVPLSANFKRIIGVLKNGEEVEYGFLGVGVNTLNMPDREGAYVDHIGDGTPARRAGLQVGETITAVNGLPVKDYDDLFLNVGSALAGAEVTLTVRRFGRERKVPVRLAKFSYPGPVIASRRPSAVFGLRVDYGSVVNADTPVPEGVYVRDVEPGSAAEKKYKDLFERGRWIIQSVNGKPVTTPAEFYKAAGRGPLELKVVEAVKDPETTARTLTLP